MIIKLAKCVEIHVCERAVRFQRRDVLDGWHS